MKGRLVDPSHRRRHNAGNNKGSQVKECGQPLQSGKNKEVDSPLEPPVGTQSCQHLGLSPMRPTSDF